jgi:hypothetical protein
MAVVDSVLLVGGIDGSAVSHGPFYAQGWVDGCGERVVRTVTSDCLTLVLARGCTGSPGADWARRAMWASSGWSDRSIRTRHPPSGTRPNVECPPWGTAGSWLRFATPGSRWVAGSRTSLGPSSPSTRTRSPKTGDALVERDPSLSVGTDAGVLPPDPGPGIPGDADEPEPWQLADALTRSSVSMTTLDFVERAITGLAASYPFTPPGEMAPQVGAMMRRMHDALGQSQPLKVRARCARLAGVLCGVAGQLADDMGRFGRASGYFDAAELAAAEAEDPDLTAWVLAIRSIGLFYRGQYAASAGLLERAEVSAEGSAARRRAWLAALSARAYAALACRAQSAGERRGVMASLARAYAKMGQEAGPPGGTEFFDAPRLAGMAGSALLLMRDTGRSRELLAEALAGRSPADTKGRALLTLDMAESFTIDGDPEQAAALGAGALDLVRGDVIQPVLERAREIGRRLRPWEDATAVRDLSGRLAEITAPWTGD